MNERSDNQQNSPMSISLDMGLFLWYSVCVNKNMNRAQFEKELAKHSGVTWDLLMEDNGDLQIDSPKGKVFRSNGCHTIVEPFSNSGHDSWKPQAYAEVIERLKMGLENCEEPDCDICEEKLIPCC